MTPWTTFLRWLANHPGLTPAERAKADQLAAAGEDLDVAMLRLDIAAHETAGALRDLAATWVAGDAALTLEEAEQVAQHPDLAELNLMLDGYYGTP